ncbi:MAG: Bax inhibitor-1/YccA family protein [Oscillospiraceae bacterium]|jgi:FtsH-binding integral membrane protein|nr:Bax inhibitor-1/YccA family protein [Oscillospiraceae bacterium]
MLNRNPYAQQQQPRDRFSSLWSGETDLEAATSSCLNRVFLRMFMALCVTAAVSAGLYYAPSPVAGYGSMTEFLLVNFENPGMSLFILIGLVVAQFGLVIFLSARVMKMSSSISNVMFFVYAILTGLSLSTIFMSFDLGIIFQAFLVSALMFGATAVYGAITKRDLSRLGSILIMALIGLIIASFVNILFVRNDTMLMLINYAGVLIFVGLTAYKTQGVKNMLNMVNSGAADSIIVADRAEAIKRISVMGALTLYLTFINLFLRILIIMSRRR